MEAMELSRSEYPSILTFVPASPAVKLLRDRLQKGQQLNNEISEWIQERRRAEDAYAQALTKLAKRPLPGESSELGVFAVPWSRIVESTAALASSHHQLALKLGTDVERPIRDFASRNSEWSGMKVMETNLGNVAKSIDASEERAEKFRKRGQKAKAQQVAEAAQAVSSAVAEWDSQAPFVFEKLQAADESRCNHLRDALTRFQTLELDHAQMTVQSASETLTLILDISSNEETKAFANKATLSRQKIERQHSRTGNNIPHPATPSVVTDDSVSVQSSGSGGGVSAGGTHSGMGLKRLGTVLRNRSNRNSIFHRSASPDMRPRGAPPPLPPSPHNRLGSPRDGTSLGIPGVSPTGDKGSPLTSQSNGDHRPLSPLSSPPAPSSGPPSVTVTTVPEEARTDSEGYTVRPPVSDLGTSAIPEEGADETQPQFKVEIKNDVIHEEEEEADAALSKVANTLRAQNTVSRKTRGRRDVRNTMFFPNPPELTPDLTGSPPLTPLRMAQRPAGAVSEEGSDTYSIKSARSVTSLAAAVIRHPDLTEPGLSASLVESVSMSFEAGQPTKTLVTGEIALACNDIQGGVEDQPLTIRMDNFAVLEKVAPNPAFISAIPDHVGEYSIAHQNLHKTVVAFKYQVHVDESNLTTYAPIIISPVWRLEPKQSSVIVTWKPNPVYRRLNGITKPLTLRNVVFIVGVEGAHASSCQSKPMGTFSKEKGRLAWKMGDLVIDPEAVQNEASKVLARFATDAPARSTPVEVRWEISGEDAESVGSELMLSTPKPKAEVGAADEETDPFADAGAEEKNTDGAEASRAAWSPVSTVRKVMSGKFIAS